MPNTLTAAIGRARRSPTLRRRGFVIRLLRRHGVIRVYEAHWRAMKAQRVQP